MDADAGEDGRSGSVLRVPFQISMGDQVNSCEAEIGEDATARDLLDLVFKVYLGGDGEALYGLYNLATGVKYHNNTSLELILEDDPFRLFIARNVQESRRLPKAH
jgi:hypothetical protein